MSGISEKIIARRWIAGPSADDAIDVSKKLKNLGIYTQINHLGEWLTDKNDVSRTVSTYLELIKKIKISQVKSDVALKLSQIGLAVDYKLAEENLTKILKYADNSGIFVWIDMEESGLVESTVRLYKAVVKEGNCGVCVQSYLKRSASDLKRIVGFRGIVRLVKGTYSESEKIAYKEPLRTKNYVKLMKYLFKNSKRFMIATHDTKMLETALDLNRKFKRTVTYAMLLGIRNELAVKLAGNGESVSIYVPFGEKWTGYAYRRLREASNLKLVIKSILKEPMTRI